MKKTTLSILAGLALLATPLSLAYAHTALSSSSIPNESVLVDAPDHMELNFGKRVGLVKVSLKPADGNTIDLEYVTPKSMQESFHIPLPTLSSGQYSFAWQIIAKDGHVMKGTIEFTIS